ncbi:hypothetical protein CF327_g575 [Tilletia walkeri]|nr:hypothetical protein CF327_g575 [Tilletia walkeri]
MSSTPSDQPQQQQQQSPSPSPSPSQLDQAPPSGSATANAAVSAPQRTPLAGQPSSVAATGPAKLVIPHSTTTASLSHKQGRPLPRSSNLGASNAESSVPNRTAVLFLGKDWERWHRYDRDSRLQLGWQPRGVASAVTDCRSAPSMSSSSSSSSDSADSGSEDDYVKHAAVFSSDDEEEEDCARRMSSSQSSSAGQRSDNDVFSVQRRLTRRARLLSSTSTSTILEFSSSRPQSPAPFSPSPHIRERRYSSNGPEAAFLRHETVIGIHTPRSPFSTSPGSSSGCHTPSERKFSLAPLSQILPSSNTGSARSADDHHQQQRQQPSTRSGSISTASLASLQMSSHKIQGAPTAPESSAEAIERATKANILSSHRTSSSQTVNPDRTPAARKISLVDGPPRKKSQLSKSRNESTSSQFAEKGTKQQHAPTHRREKQIRSHSHNSRQPSSSRHRRPRIHLAPAPRCPSMPVEGTLYDEDGPFVEGAVQDGLSVRIFNGVDILGPNREPARHEAAAETDLGLDLNKGSKQDEEQGHGIITYLITTPDNRVSSAAKLRRWAMDSNGNFYAAMEIKSVEAKLRAGGALPDMAAMGDGGAQDADEIHQYSRELIRCMQETYVEDIVLEIQKAQTLNPDRSTVSRLLETRDGKYVRLEEDYPEEAFFVLVGCEEFELYPVVALVFVQALRALARFHDAGWLHGDVKLENLMFDVQGRLVVIDYENANMFRKPRRRRHHHHGQRHHKESRGTSSGRRPGAGERSRPSTNTIRPSSHSSSQREARDELGALPTGGKLPSRSPSISPVQRRLLLDAAGGETIEAGIGTHHEDPVGGLGSDAPTLGLGLESAPAMVTGMSREDSRTSSQLLYADDEAEASDEDEDDEHLVRLISYDWTPPEANLSPWSASYNSSSTGGAGGNGNGNGNGNGTGFGNGGGGRMMGPTGDLWALGCNLIRAFALRDGMADLEVREVLLGTGQRAFFKHRANLLASLQKAKAEGGDAGARKGVAVSNGTEVEAGKTLVAASDTTPAEGKDQGVDSDVPATPAARVLHRFSREASKLMHFVLARCVTPFPSERGWEAELEGLALADELERERLREPIPVDDQRSPALGTGMSSAEGSLGAGGSTQPPLRKVDAEEEEAPPGPVVESVQPGLVNVPAATVQEASGVSLGKNGSSDELPLLMDVAQVAILKAISMSGSMWVRPKLEQARRSLGLGECGSDEYDDYDGCAYDEEGGPGYEGDYGCSGGEGYSYGPGGYSGTNGQGAF